MPSYQYACIACGPFALWRAMADWDKPSDCPACGAPAPRLAAAPHVRGGRTALHYKVEERNERSAFEPKMVRHFGRKNQDLEDRGHTKHRNRLASNGQKHAHDHAHASSHRPWMVGH